MIFGMFPSFILAVFSVQRQTNTVNMGCALSSFSFEDISCLGDSTSLSEVSLDGNPITTQEQYYKQIVLRHMQQLKQLDMKRVTVSSESPSLYCVVFLISYMAHKIGPNTLQPLYNTIYYNTVLDTTQFKGGSQKCIDYIEK